MGYKLHGRVIMMGQMYISCYITVMHLLNVLELRGQVYKKIPFLQFYNNLVLLNILRMNIHNVTKFCVHFIIDKICVGIIKRHCFVNLRQSYGP